MRRDVNGPVPPLAPLPPSHPASIRSAGPPLSKTVQKYGTWDVERKRRDRREGGTQPVFEDEQPTYNNSCCADRKGQQTQEDRESRFPIYVSAKERYCCTATAVETGSGWREASTQHVQEEEFQGEKQRGGGGAEIAEIAEISSRPAQLRRTA